MSNKILIDFELKIQGYRLLENIQSEGIIQN